MFQTELLTSTPAGWGGRCLEPKEASFQEQANHKQYHHSKLADTQLSNLVVVCRRTILPGASQEFCPGYKMQVLGQLKQQQNHNITLNPINMYTQLYQGTPKDLWKMELKGKFIFVQGMLKSMHPRSFLESSWKMPIIKKQTWISKSV